jgi:hypothetical protein
MRDVSVAVATGELGRRSDGIANQQRDDRSDCDVRRTDQRGDTDDEGAGREQREGNRGGVAPGSPRKVCTLRRLCRERAPKSWLLHSWGKHCQ